MKKIYLLLLCFGIAFFALSIPYFTKTIIFKNDFIEKEKTGKKSLKNSPKKLYTTNKKIKNAKFGAVGPTISAVQTVTVDGGGNAVPGGQLNYSFILSNSGADALNVNFTDQLIADLTLVPGSVKSTPIVQNETYQSIGNVGITVPEGNGVLSNDNSPTGEAMAATVTTTTANGVLNLATNGSFTYLPNPGFVGNDSFTYTVTTGTTSSTGIGTIQVSGMIWFVNPTAGSSGTGTLQSPFKNMGDIAGTTAGNTIFVYEGATTGATTLLNNQKIVGQGATVALVGAGSISGIAVPTFSNTLPNTGGARPEWSHNTTALTLASANDVEGINITTSGGTTVTGASVGDLKIKQVALNNTNGQALQIDAGGALDATFDYISSANGAKGISVKNSTGAFQVLGTGAAGSGGNILAKTTRGVEFINCSNITLKNMDFNSANTNDGTITASANNDANAAIHGSQVSGLTLDNIHVAGTTSQVGLNLNGCSNLTLTNSSFANCGTAGVTNEGGIVAMNLNGTSIISNVSVTTSGGRNAYIRNTSTTALNLTVSGSTFNTANDASNFLFEGNDNTNSTLTIKSNTFSNATTHALDVNANGTCTVNVQIGGPNVADKNTVNARTTSPGSDGIFVQGSGTPNVNYNIINNQIQTSFNGYFPINVGGQGTGGQFMGRINSNTTSILNAIVPTSGMGIYAGAYGRVKHITEIKNNTINNAGNYGIQAESNNNNTASADATMDATIQNNVVNMIVDGAGYSHYGLTANSLNTGSGNIVTCANMSGNTSVSPSNAALNLELSSNAIGVPATNAVIKLQGNYGALPAAWTTPNPLGGSTALDAGGGGTITLFGAFACLTPTNPSAARIGVEEILAETRPELEENTIENSISAIEAQQIINKSGVNTDFGVNKNLEVKSTINTNSNLGVTESVISKVQSGETITVNGSGSGFTLPQGKTTTITFSATIAAEPTTCNILSIANVSGSNFATVNSNSVGYEIFIETPTNTQISDAEVCAGESSILTGGCPAGTLKWYNAMDALSTYGTGPSVALNNLTSTTPIFASCTVGGCEGSRISVGTITVNQLPNATITANASVCQFGTANLSVPATGLASVLWAGTGITSTNTNPTTAKPIYIGNVSYDVVVTDVNGCTATASKQVMVNPTPLVTAGTNQTVCEDNQVTLLGNCVYNVYGTLSGTAEVPANNSAGKGMVTGYYDANTNTLSLSLFYAGLSGTANNAHIHGPAAVGTNNVVLQGLTGFTFGSNSGSYSQTFTDVSYGAAIIAGETYVNIHSTAFSGGELRAQLTAVCTGDEFTWNPGNLTGLSVNITPPLPEETYTLTAKNSVTGCENNTPATVIISVDPVTLPTGPTTNTQNVANVQLIANACEYVARVVPTAGFTDATVKSFVEMTPPYSYVPRHFQITPATNISTATGNITLFFSQDDFTAYNGTIGSNLFPTGPSDAPGIANIQIVKVPDGGGSPLIIPTNGANWNNVSGYTVIWNTALEIWEITFPVTGFSEFYAKSAATPLPINLISFTGKATQKGNDLAWKTTNEKNFSHFEIQRSENAKIFDTLGEVKGNSSEKYEYQDRTPPLGVGGLYYRLKMIDLDGTYTFSKIISIENIIGKAIVGNFYPNPSQGKSYIEINALEKGRWNITTFDLTGKALKIDQKLLEKGKNIVTIEKLQQGVNFVKFENGVISEIRKIIKE